MYTFSYYAYTFRYVYIYTHYNNLYALMCNYVLTTTYAILDECYG